MKSWGLLVWTLWMSAMSSASAASVHAQASRWEDAGEDDGVRLWKRELPGLDLPGFRGEATIDAPLSQIQAAIEDAQHHTEWMYRCAKSEILERKSAEESVLYNRTASPWPVWDRDVVLDIRTNAASDGQVVTLSFQNSQTSSVPVPDKVVRMPRLVGFYKLVKLGEAQTKVTYQVEADPGGSLPRWVAVRIARDLPLQTLSRLRARVTTKRRS